MKINSLKIIAIVIGGATCFSTTVSAQASAKSQATMESGAPGARDSSGGAKAGAGQTANTAQFSDPEILGCVLAIDENEISAASRAEKKKIGPEAMAYAKMLRTQHRDDAAKIKKLGKQLEMKPAGSKTSEQLRAKGAEELKSLSAKDGSDFERAYIDAMVEGHTEALQLFDTQLIPSARNDALKKQLAETRGHVAMHLEQGKRLQGAQASR